MRFNRFVKFIRLRIMRLSAKSGALASLYYALFDNSFRREHVSVLRGKIEQLHNSKRMDPLRYTLRRNIHRLEKGLIMRPRRDTFALDYIHETVRAYCIVVPNDSGVSWRQDEIKWYTDVLECYFAVSCLNSDTARLKSEFLTFRISSNGRASAPYRRSDIIHSGVSYAALLALLRQRRSTRWFLPRSVGRELIDQAISASLQAPSACNRQPFSFRVIDDKASCAEIAAIPMGTRGYAGNIPVMIALIGKLDAYFDERDRHVIYIDGSLAAMCLMLALETLGLSSCPINWPDIEDREKKMATALDLKAWERPIMLLAVGYPDPHGEIPYSEKAPLEAMRFYDDKRLTSSSGGQGEGIHIEAKQ